jgi:hypothetical protein
MKKVLKFNTLTLLAFIMLSIFSTSCKKNNNLSPSDFSSIKNDNWRDNIGKEFEVEGFVIDEGSGSTVIVSDNKDYELDGLFPEAEYLHIVFDSRNDNLSNLHGRKVRLRGILQANTETSIVGSAGFLGDKSLATLKFIPQSTKLIDSVSYFRQPSRVSFCDRYPIICSLSVNPIGTKCAILYSGGINSSKAYARYWNDLKFMYGILLSKGYTADNIRVVYKNGVGNDGDIPVHYAATPTGFNDAVEYMKPRLNTQSKLFLMFNNHGGGYETSTGDNYGEPDLNLDEPDLDLGTDENYCYYGVSDPFIDDSIAAKINRLQFADLIAIVKPCFSGGLIWDLRGANRIIITSGTEYQVTWPHASLNYGEMTYRFFGAITGTSPDGVPVNADLNTDGNISMYEAYIYIRDNDARFEQPQFGNSTTGMPTTTPSSSGYGSNVFL